MFQPQWPAKGVDVHFDIVQEGAPPDFESEPCDITFANAANTYNGPGSVAATSNGCRGEITYDDPLDIGELHDYGGVPGRLIPEEEYANVDPVVPATPSWTATGGDIVHQDLTDMLRPTSRFKLQSVAVEFAKGAVAYTREIHRGAQINCLRQTTPTPGGGWRADRFGGKALGRRTTIRNLGAYGELNKLIAIVYDGTPHESLARQALWLGVSTLAGQDIQPIAVETYDAQGTLLTRLYQLGASPSAGVDQPFHSSHAPFDRTWIEPIVDGIYQRLVDGFPIEIIIAHLHDGASGSMERRMQSYLFGLHAASEAWNRRHGAKTFVPHAVWSAFAGRVGAILERLAGRLNPDLGTAVAQKLREANNIGTGARMRAFFAAMRIALAGKDKTAEGLRNKLFHDGYFQRRFAQLTYAERQERVDQQQRLRDLLMRVMFALIGFDGTFQGALYQYKRIPVHNLTSEPDGQP